MISQSSSRFSTRAVVPECTLGGRKYVAIEKRKDSIARAGKMTVSRMIKVPLFM
jgi:hypothetical protein